MPDCLRARRVVWFLLLELAGCVTPLLLSASPRFDLLQPGLLMGTPPGGGPFPVVILLHGCGGRREFPRRIGSMHGNFARKDVMLSP